MKRRDFVQKAGVGAIGVSMLQPLADPFGIFQKKDHRLWLRQLSVATGMRWIDHIGGTPSTLITATKHVNGKFASAGYQHTNSGYYFYPCRERICLYGLELIQPSSDDSDILLPVLHEAADGTWVHFATINGFQLEALARASKALNRYPEPLDRLLLPFYARQSTTRSGVLKSEDADIEIKTVLHKDFGAKTHITVSASGHTVFDDTFISAHCLSCSTSVV